jgi:DnaJ homolog subfamily A member 5
MSNLNFTLIFHFRQLEESYLNQFSDSEHEDDSEASDDDLTEAQEGVEACNFDESEEIFDDELYCVACNKFFNSESAKLNHEASKKHRQNVEKLKSEMNAEEENYQQNNLNEEQEEELGEEEEEIEVVKKSKKSRKKSKKMFVKENSEAEEIEEKVEVEEVKLNLSDDEKDDDWANSKKSKKTKAKGKTKSEKPKVLQVEEKVEIEPATSQNEDENLAENRCATCKEIFPSKNKLFAHLKKTNHSIYLGEVKAKTGEKSKKKR